ALRSLRASVGFWRSLKLSIMARVSLSKMIMLPRLLYYFTNLAVLLPLAWFRELNSLLRDLIWDGGRRHTALTFMCRLTSAGGLGVPDFELYYLACQLQCISRWCTWEGRLDSYTPNGAIDTEWIIAQMIGRRVEAQEGSVMTKVALSCWKRCSRRMREGRPYFAALPLSVITQGTKEGTLLGSGLGVWSKAGVE
ncbi:hypothetical protein NDU88_003570, partial [Pleurodeles waltl]